MQKKAKEDIISVGNIWMINTVCSEDSNLLVYFFFFPLRHKRKKNIRTYSKNSLLFSFSLFTFCWNKHIQLKFWAFEEGEGEEEPLKGLLLIN